MFEVRKRDGAARIGSLTIGERTVITPSLAIIQHERFQVELPGEIEYLILTQKDGTSMLEGIPLTAVKEVHRVRKIVGSPEEKAWRLVTSSEETGYGATLFIPGSGLVHEFAQMVYSGVDLFDTSPSILYARRGYYLTAYGPVESSVWEKERCFCPSCKEGRKNFKDILLHNILASIQELATIREFIQAGRLRHLVEIRMRSHPELWSLLRFLDRDHYPFFRKRMPFMGGGVMGVSEDVFQAPEVRYYRERLQGYRKPWGEILLLLPCSVRKPYSISRSHRRFAKVTRNYPGKIHELIVTSPLGLVPRELEIFYPPANYDISVTGEWSQEEQQMIERMLTDLLGQNHYAAIVDHTPYDFVGTILEEIRNCQKGLIGEVVHSVVNGNPGSSESLGTLGDALERLTSSSDPISSKKLKTSIFRNMWRFQFGPGSERVLGDVTVKGRFPFYKAYGEGQQSQQEQKELQGEQRLQEMKEPQGEQGLLDQKEPQGEHGQQELKELQGQQWQQNQKGLKESQDQQGQHEIQGQIELQDQKEKQRPQPQIAMVVPKAKRISLTLQGGMLLNDMKINRVFIGDFKPAGDIFAVGIEDADPGIGVGDEVVVVHGDEVRGVGVAQMNTEEMIEVTRGVGVRIRHRKK